MTATAPLPPRKALVRAYRRWLLSLMEQEIASGYPRLHELREYISTYFFELSKSWSREEVMTYVDTRMKKSFAWFEESTAALSVEEEATLARFEFPNAYSPAVLALIARRFAGEFKLDKRLFERTVKRSLQDALGTKGKSWDGTTRYVSHLTEVTVYTNVDFGMKSVQLANWHNVVAGRVDHSVDASQDQLFLSQCSLANLYGLGALDWHFIAPEGVTRVAAFLAKSSLEFIAAVPEIIAAARREIN